MSTQPNTVNHAKLVSDLLPAPMHKCRPPMVPMPMFPYARRCKCDRVAIDHPYQLLRHFYRGQAFPNCTLLPTLMSILLNTMVYIFSSAASGMRPDETQWKSTTTSTTHRRCLAQRTSVKRKERNENRKIKWNKKNKTKIVYKKKKIFSSVKKCE